MLLDAQNLFSDAQIVTTGSENGVLSTNVIDLGVARNVGAGEEIYLVVTCVTAMTSSGSDDTLRVDLITDDNAGMNSATVLDIVGTFPAASAAGTRFVKRLPVTDSYERYLGLRYTAATGPLTAGAFDAFLTKDIDALRSYPKGYTIS